MFQKDSLFLACQNSSVSQPCVNSGDCLLYSRNLQKNYFLGVTEFLPTCAHSSNQQKLMEFFLQLTSLLCGSLPTNSSLQPYQLIYLPSQLSEVAMNCLRSSSWCCISKCYSRQKVKNYRVYLICLPFFSKIITLCCLRSMPENSCFICLFYFLVYGRMVSPAPVISNMTISRSQK